MSRSMIAALAFAVPLALTVSVGAPAQAKPGGCLKYGAAGALAGHAAGGHAFKGALAGCALGWYERRRYNRSVREQQNGAPQSQPQLQQGRNL